jgi:hypothetical protein
MAGYSPDVIRDFAERFGSIAKAEEKALTVPGFGEEILRVEAEINWLSTLWHEPPGRREELEGERRALVVEALSEGASPRPRASESGKNVYVNPTSSRLRSSMLASGRCGNALLL